MNDIGKEEKGIESRHPSDIYIFRHGGKEGGGDRAIWILILYMYFGTMTIPALDQYLAIGRT